MNTDSILKGGENQVVVFKEALNLKYEVGRNVSAFSNSEEDVLIGVSDSVIKNNLESIRFKAE